MAWKLALSWQTTRAEFFETADLPSTITVDHESVDMVDNFIYLSNVWERHWAVARVIQKRIEIAKDVLEHLDTELRLFHSLVMPLLLYGIGT